MSGKRMRRKGTDRMTGDSLTMPKTEVTRFFQQVGQRAWTDAEKELDNIRQKSDGEQWSRGYVKALEGLLLTFRTNDDKYIYLPRAFSSATDEAAKSLRTEFEQFSSNDIHGEYDRGYFRALQDFLTSGPEPKLQESESTLPDKSTGHENPKQAATPMPDEE